MIEELSALQEKMGVASVPWLDEIETLAERVVVAYKEDPDRDAFNISLRGCKKINSFFEVIIMVKVTDDMIYDGATYSMADDHKWAWLEDKEKGIKRLGDCKIDLMVCKDMEIVSLKTLLIHEFNHLYETYREHEEMMKLREEDRHLMSHSDGIVDLQMVMRLRNITHDEMFFMLLDMLYKLWAPGERRAFIAETIGEFSKEETWKNNKAQYAAMEAWNSSNAKKMIDGFQEVIDRFDDVIDAGMLRKVQKLCFKSKQVKMMPEEKFKKFFYERSVKLLGYVKKKLSKVIALGKDLNEH